jgi:hypothetical protein
MKTFETPEAIVVEPTPTGNASYKPSPRVPPTNLQRFEPGKSGPCVCSYAAILDKVTGLCVSCWRVFLFGGR